MDSKAFPYKPYTVCRRFWFVIQFQARILSPAHFAILVRWFENHLPNPIIFLGLPQNIASRPFKNGKFLTSSQLLACCYSYKAYTSGPTTRVRAKLAPVNFRCRWINPLSRPKRSASSMSNFCRVIHI